MGDMKQKKTQLYLIIIFFLLLAVLYVYFVHPISKKAAATETNAVNQKQLYASLEAKAAQIAQIPDLDRIKLEAVRKQVPEQPYLDSILRDLRQLEVVSQTIMLQYNMIVGSASVDDPNQPKNASSEGNNSTAQSVISGNVIPIKIETSFVGNYEQVSKLFAELESLDRLIQVDKLTFNIKQGPLVQINNPDALIYSNLSLVAYYSPSLQAILKQPYSLDYTNTNGRTNPFN